MEVLTISILLVGLVAGTSAGLGFGIIAMSRKVA